MGGGWWVAGGGWRVAGGGWWVVGGGWWVVGGGWWVVGGGLVGGGGGGHEIRFLAGTLVMIPVMTKELVNQYCCLVVGSQPSCLAQARKNALGAGRWAQQMRIDRGRNSYQS